MNREVAHSLVNLTVSCGDEYSVDSNIYRKIVGTIIFIIVWPFIVLDIKSLPLGRPAAALFGATLMVITIVVPQDQVYYILGEKGNLQTLCLLVGMMLLSYYYDREGMLQVVALWIFGENKPFRHVLWKVCTLSAVLSAVITNDATCLVITPLLLNEHIKQKRSPKEYPSLLIGIATSANIGSAATFFGNPQNAFIAANSNGEVSLLIFFATALPAAILGMVCSVVLLNIFYIRTICATTPTVDLTIEMSSSDNAEHDDHTDAPRSRSDTRNFTITEMTSLADSCREVALSYDRSIDPQSTSCIAQERVDHFKYLETYPGSRSSSYSRIKCYPAEGTYYAENRGSHYAEYGTTPRDFQWNDHIRSGHRSHLQAQNDDNTHLLNNDSSTHADSESASSNAGRDETCPKWKKRVFCVWLIAATIVLVVLLAIPPPPTVSVEFNLGLVPVGLSVFTMVVDTLLNWKYAFDAMMKIDWTVILLFIGLFVWLGGFQNTKFPSRAFKFLQPYMDLYTTRGVFLFSAFVIIGSNILSNVPLVILIVDKLNKFYCAEQEPRDAYCSAQLVGVLLAWISTIAGNFTLIGSVANLIVAEKARNVADYRLTFWEYFKFGFCSTFLVLLIGTPIVYYAGARVHF